MRIDLYNHNKIAYDNALFLLQTEKKAVVVHPTGTGKSFIVFKLCEDNPDKTICWLSPSEYIFDTQLENLKRATGGYVPQNISFFTYAKLMNMSKAEIAEIEPDYIILDEYHRCGAQMWGQGVETLLSEYPAHRFWVCPQQPYVILTIKEIWQMNFLTGILPPKCRLAKQ